MDPRSPRSRKHPGLGALAALLSTFPLSGLCVQVDYQLGLGVMRSDNIDLSAVNPQDETIVVPELRFGIEQSGAVLSLTANGQVQYLNYLDNTYSDGFRGAFSGTALWTMVPDRLQWTFEDHLSMQPIDTLAAFTPNNEQQTNVLITGPSLFVGAGDATRGQLDIRYIRTYAQEDANFDSDRYSIAARLLHDLDTASNLSANLEALQVTYDTGLPGARYTRHDAYERYWRQLRDLELTVDIGYSWLKYEGGREDESLPLARGNLNWRITPRSSLMLGANYQFSDAAENLVVADSLVGNGTIGGIPGTPTIPISTGVFKDRGLQFGYEYAGERLGAAIRSYYKRIDYIEQPAQGERNTGGYASASYRLRPRTTLQLAALVENRRFEDPVATNRDTTGSVYLENEFSRHWIARIELQRRERDSSIIGQDYKENVAIVSFSYRR